MRKGLLRTLLIVITPMLLFGLITFDSVGYGGLIHVCLWYTFSFVVCGSQLVLMVWSIYQIVISTGGLFPRKRSVTELKLKQFPKILCLTAAHNEEQVIREHVRNLRFLDYPKERYDIVVIADNCSDKTADIVLEEGALVWERSDNVQRGKGYALKWALYHRANLEDYDAVCIFDADNLVDPNFLSVMASCLQEGHVAIQGYLDTKNPWDSWTTAAYASAYWFMNRFWQKARIRFGLSAALGGTGFCLSTKALKEVPWEAMSLTEDLEYTVQLLLKGYKVHWTDESHVYDEKPIYFRDTLPQRRRWMQGHWNTAFRYSYALFKQMKAVNSNTYSFQAVDFLIYLWQPSVILLMGLDLLFTIAQFFYGPSWFHPWLLPLLTSPFCSVIEIVGFVSPLVAFVLERSGWRSFLYFPLYLVFNLTWILVSFEGILQLRNTEWIHTKHSRSIKLKDVSPRFRSNELE